MLNLGQRVRYVRNKNWEITQGEGVILAFSIDHMRRAVATIREAGETFNVDVKALNPTDEFVETFTKLVGDIKALEDEANKKNAEIVSDYNGRIGEIITAVLGEPITLQFTEDELKDEPKT